MPATKRKAAGKAPPKRATPKHPPNPRGVLTVEAAADYLSLSVRMMYRLLSGGMIDSLKVGYRRYVPLAALERFIEEGVEAERRARGA